MMALDMVETPPGVKKFRGETTEEDASPLDATILEAERAADEYQQRYNMLTVDIRPYRLRALAAIYRVFLALDADPEARGSFLKRKGVKPMAQARNPAQPIVKAFFPKNAHADLRR